MLGTSLTSLCRISSMCLPSTSLCVGLDHNSPPAPFFPTLVQGASSDVLCMQQSSFVTSALLPTTPEPQTVLLPPSPDQCIRTAEWHLKSPLAIMSSHSSGFRVTPRSCYSPSPEPHLLLPFSPSSPLSLSVCSGPHLRSSSRSLLPSLFGSPIRRALPLQGLHVSATYETASRALNKPSEEM